VDRDAAVVELYGLPAGQFVAARNQLAKAVRDRGDEPTAAAIVALRKPTVAAWLANQLVRADPDGIHALTELGEQLRRTYLTADSARRRELTRQRHDLVGHLVHTASQRGRRPPRHRPDRGAADRNPRRRTRRPRRRTAVGYRAADQHATPRRLRRR
jgi:hypothetical protein